MRHSTERILTTHAGSLPRPVSLIETYQEMYQTIMSGGKVDEDRRNDSLGPAVAEIVRQQVDVGVDVVDDGEYGKPAFGTVDYGPWSNYAYQRLTGWEPEGARPNQSPATPPGDSAGVYGWPSGASAVRRVL